MNDPLCNCILTLVNCTIGQIGIKGFVNVCDVLEGLALLLEEFINIVFVFDKLVCSISLSSVNTTFLSNGRRGGTLPCRELLNRRRSLSKHNLINMG
jgi:hypothetical protein